MKKILLTLFTFVLALNAAAQNGIVYNPDFKTSGESCGVSWSVNTDNWELIINGNGKMPDQVSAQNVEWLTTVRTVQFYLNNEIHYTFEERLADKITKITINEGIEQIGAYCFFSMPNLKEISLPSTLTSIGKNAFNGCSQLSTLTGDCYWSELSLDATSFSGTKVIRDNGALYIGEKLICVYEAYGATELEIEAGTSEICANAFEGNIKVKSISIPYGVSKIGDNAFSGCKNLSTFTLDANNVTFGSNVFADCSSLTTFTLNANNVTFGSNVFAGCSSLPIDGPYRKAGDNIIVEVYETDEEIYQIPSDIIYIADNAFANCKNVKTIKCASTPAMATTALLNDNDPYLYVEDGNEDKFQGKGISRYNINHTEINLHSSGYSTIALDHSAMIPEGVEAYTVTSDGTKINYKRVKGNKLAKGTGYFIVGTGKVIFTPAKESIAEGNDNNLVGVTEKAEVSGSNIYFLSTTQGGVTGFFCLGNSSYEFPANKAYLQVSGTIGNAQYFLVHLDETETRIDNTESEEKTSHSRNNVYNLAGQKMSHPQKGINIVNGKLTIM